MKHNKRLFVGILSASIALNSCLPAMAADKTNYDANRKANEKADERYDSHSENILEKISVGSDMESLWNEEVEKLHFCTYLNEKDIEFLKKTGHVLVRADAQNVEKMFLGLYRELDLIIENAIEEEKEKGRLFKSLGILFGLFISVVFA